MPAPSSPSPPSPSYLLLQIPWEFTVAGVLALAGILLAVAHDAPDAL